MVGGTPVNLTEKPLDRPIQGHAWRRPDQMLAIDEQGFASRLVLIGLDGKFKPIDHVEVNPVGRAVAERIRETWHSWVRRQRNRLKSG